jgi:hypothetical protein
MQSADGLDFYIAIIGNKNRDRFDTVLSGISELSNVRPGNRLTTIAPMEETTVYEVSLSTDEAIVLALACPGEYLHYPNEENRLNMISLLISKYQNE